MIARFLYNLALPVARFAAHVTALFIPKMQAALDGRRGFRERYQRLRVELSDRPVWFHVSSVGEFEQARPLITAMAERHPDIPVVLTFSSPSGIRFATSREKVGDGSNLAFIDYLPIDTAGNMRFCLDCVNPRALVLVKFDIWPNLVFETKDRGVPIILIDATLSTSSQRLSGAGKWFYANVYRRLDRIMAISEDDAQRFRDAVPDHAGIGVTGDTRFDRVMERWQQRSDTEFAFARNDHPVVIAGSTWPRDEAHLLPALAELLERHPGLRVIIAPHEPEPERVAALRRWAEGLGHTPGTVTEGIGDSRVTLIDTVGVLAEAYRLADVAYVGGSFSTGVHSVIEPAIAGLPVVFGPLHQNSFEALCLLDQGGGFCARNAAEMTDHLGRLVAQPEARAAAGTASRAYVESQLGASEKCMAVLEEFL